MTSKYFRLGRDVIVASPISFCLLLIRTASVLCAAKAGPLEASFFAVTTMATPSAKPMRS